MCPLMKSLACVTTGTVQCAIVSILLVLLLVIALVMLLRPKMGVGLDRKWLTFLCKLIKNCGYELKLVSVDEARAARVTRRNGLALLIILALVFAFKSFFWRLLISICY